MLDTLRPLFASLSSHGVEYLVIGGVAVIAHGVPRLTLDVDILIRPTYDNAVNLLRAFEEAGLGTAALTTADEILAAEVVIFKDRIRVDVQTRAAAGTPSPGPTRPGCGLTGPRRAPALLPAVGVGRRQVVVSGNAENPLSWAPA